MIFSSYSRIIYNENESKITLHRVWKSKKAVDIEMRLHEEKASGKDKASVKSVSAEQKAQIAEEVAAAEEAGLSSPRRSIAFIGSECYPFLKTGDLKDTVDPYDAIGGYLQKKNNLDGAAVSGSVQIICAHNE